MLLTYEGQTYDITNWEEFKETLLETIGKQTVMEIQKEIGKLRLVNTGDYRRDTIYQVQNGDLMIMNLQPYAPFLEYGTAGSRKGVVDPFGERTRGPKPNRKMPIKENAAGKISIKGKKFSLVEDLENWKKKKGVQMSDWLLAKRIQEYGMEAYAPFRRILYNQQKMNKIINRAVKLGSS